MATYSYESIVKDLRAKKLAPVYFFSGEESFYAQQLLEVIEKELLDEAERSFNQSVLYGKGHEHVTNLRGGEAFPYDE